MRRFPLAILPTPCHRLEHASRILGVDLWIKRDDLTGFALGGNKARKLEFLIADALEQGAQTVVSCGATQSNFIRQLAAACAVAGLRCIAAVMDLPFEEAPTIPEVPGLNGQNGNMVLNQLFGAEIHRFPNDEWEILYAHAAELAKRERQRGQKVFEIPIGGSTPQGVYAFSLAANELQESFDWVVTASSSGSTQVGLASALPQSRVLGIACDPEPQIAEDFAALSAEAHALFPHLPLLKFEDFELDFSAVGPGYGIPSEEGDEAIAWLAQTEGILIDPIYSGKAFGALLRLVRERQISGKVLFWHTGGTPTLFARS